MGRGLTMGKIQVLPEEAIRKIAAGEVVERPAAVVKELVENSLDAGASKILIEIEGGGVELIRVVDDGEGMAEDELPLAVERHATSKIRQAEDLSNIRSLGFRGEALPSIAAVSLLEIVSRTAGQLAGKRLILEGGRRVSWDDHPAPRGTSVTVRHLFFNTPARKKFLRSTTAEASAVAEMVLRLALSHPEVSFQLVRDGRRVLATGGSGDLRATIADLFGQKEARQLIPVTAGALEDSLPLRVSGFLGAPQQARGNRSQQYLFLNGRVIKSPALRAVAEEAYGRLLPPGRYPIFFLYLELDPADFDVNVHPAKHEVRFYREKELQSRFYHILREALRRAEAVPEIGLATVGGETAAAEENDRVQGDFEPISWPKPEVAAQVTERQEIFPGVQRQPTDLTTSSAGWWWHDGWSLRSAEEQTGTRENLFPAEWRILGQLRKTYILAEGKDGLYLVDQHAAHERVFYEYYLAKKGKLGQEIQEYLLPPVLELTPLEYSWWEEVKDQLGELGFHTREFGGRSVVIKAAPKEIQAALSRDFFADLLNRLQEGPGRTADKWQAAAAALAGCRAAIKAQQELSWAEMEDLLTQLAACQEPLRCPHGRPTVLRLSYQKLEHYFQRR